MIVMLTGQPGSGKTTLATWLVEQHDWFAIDGDLMRTTFPTGYDAAGRVGNVDRAHIVARYVEAAGFPVVISVVQPYAAQRDVLKSHGAVEVHLSGQPGDRPDEYMVDDYEIPTAPHLTIDTEEDSIEDAIRAIHRTLADLS